MRRTSFECTPDKGSPAPAVKLQARWDRLQAVETLGLDILNFIQRPFEGIFLEEIGSRIKILTASQTICNAAVTNLIDSYVILRGNFGSLPVQILAHGDIVDHDRTSPSIVLKNSRGDITEYKIPHTGCFASGKDAAAICAMSISFGAVGDRFASASRNIVLQNGHEAPTTSAPVSISSLARV